MVFKISNELLNKFRNEEISPLELRAFEDDVFKNNRKNNQKIEKQERTHRP